MVGEAAVCCLMPWGRIFCKHLSSGRQSWQMSRLVEQFRGFPGRCLADVRPVSCVARAVFALPGRHRKRMRTTNMLERLHEEIKRRTRVARLFPNEASLLRLVSAIEMEISEDWIAGKRYLDMNVKMENENESADSKEKRIYRKNVA